MTTIHPYFLDTANDAKLLIDYAELLLILLRDDCVCVRNEASNIVISLTHSIRSDSDVVQKGEHEKCIAGIPMKKKKTVD